MPKYDIALILTVDAPTYLDALDEAEAFCDGVVLFGPAPDNISAVINYERDNEGQRVVYLPKETV